MDMKLSDLLGAPCIFCGYKGNLYYQKGTHRLDCPWIEIGGLDERLERLPSLIKMLAASYGQAKGRS
jgi:hypothetical protein